jgi:hypothetical protein
LDSILEKILNEYLLNKAYLKEIENQIAKEELLSFLSISVFFFYFCQVTRTRCSALEIRNNSPRYLTKTEK